MRSGDLGIKLHFDPELQIALTAFYTWLSNDIAFDAREGRLERIGQSRRMGSVLYIKTQPSRWLLGTLSVTYVDAELLDPPPPTADDPQPPFEKGQNLPYIPPLVVRTDLSASQTLIDDFYAAELNAKFGLGFSFLSSRPLPYGRFADPVALLDSSVVLSWKNLGLSFEIYNLLDSQYAAAVYNFSSNWNPNAPQTRLPEQHIAAGAPRTFMSTLQVKL
ncbi:MAG: TonB-dependent receptor [Myxococcales bacterium]|nr:MAG: TonB-dependent receptor [Myxococcales bacterium]